MKVQFKFVTEVSDDMRRAVNYHFGQGGLANHTQMADWYNFSAHERDQEVMNNWLQHIHNEVDEKQLETIDPYDQKTVKAKLTNRH
jgi:hypothetical protein